MLPMLEIVRMEDRERVGRVVGCRDQIIAVVGLEHRRVAVAAQDRRRDVLGQQRPPRRALDGYSAAAVKCGSRVPKSRASAAKKCA